MAIVTVLKAYYLKVVILMKHKYLNEIKVAEAYLSGNKHQYDESDSIELSVKYLIVQGKSPQTILKQINNDKYNNFIMYCIEKYSNNKTSMQSRDYLPIYETELDTIMSLCDAKKRALLFVMLVYAKIDGNGWYNETIRNTGERHFQNLFKMAKIKLSKDKQMGILHDIYKQGFVSLPFMRKTNRVGLKLNYIANDGEMAIKIDSLDDLTEKLFQYNNEKVCAECGKLLTNKYNSRKFCTPCSKKNRAPKTKKPISEVKNANSNLL